MKGPELAVFAFFIMGLLTLLTLMNIASSLEKIVSHLRWFVDLERDPVRTKERQP